MTTNVLLLPLMTISFEVATNEEWRDGIQFLNADGTQMDITGITFKAQMRRAVGDPLSLLDLSTDNGYFVNNGSNGLLMWNVPVAIMNEINPSGDNGYVMDLVAEADGHTRNLWENPATVIVLKGVTTP